MSLKSFVNKVQKQKLIYWETNGFDGYGQNTYAYPEELNCRWDEVYETVKDPQGREFVSKAVIISPKLLVQGSYVKKSLLLTSTPPSPNDDTDVYMIRNTSHTPDIRGNNLLYMAYI
jgi:hypothetical protein